jgi:5-hydroxyisourate hydrolase-like protein (transthyretin family)
MESIDPHLFIPFVLKIVETEKEVTIQDPESLISQAIEFAIQFMAADMDKKDDEVIIGFSRIGWPFWTFLIDTNYGYFVDGLQISSADIQITTPPSYDDLMKLNVEMDDYSSILKSINSELSKRRPSKYKLKIAGFFKPDLMELISSLFIHAKKSDNEETIPITPLVSQTTAKEYTKELNNLLSSIDKNLLEFKELKQSVLTSSTNWVEDIVKTSTLQEENYDSQINQIIAQVNANIIEYNSILENQIHQLNEDKQSKANSEINTLREELEPHINVLRLLYVEVRDVFKEVKEEQFVESILSKVGTMVKFANKDAKKIEDIVRRITYSYENCNDKIKHIYEEFESKKEKLKKENSERIEKEKEKVEKLRTEKQARMKELAIMKENLSEERTKLNETLDKVEITLSSTQWKPSFLSQVEWNDKVNKNDKIYIPLILNKYAKKGDRNRIRFNVKLPVVIDLESPKTIKEQMKSITHPTQKKISALNKMINDKIKGDKQLQKTFDDAFLQLDFTTDKGKKEVLIRGLSEMKEKNFISEDKGEYYMKQFDEIIPRGHNNQL